MQDYTQAELRRLEVAVVAMKSGVRLMHTHGQPEGIGHLDLAGAEVLPASFAELLQAFGCVAPADPGLPLGGKAAAPQSWGWVTGGGAKAKHSGCHRAPHDWYVEERWCNTMLLDAMREIMAPEDSPHDPCCGEGRILSEAERRGLKVSGSDLVARDWRGDWRRHDYRGDPLSHLPDVDHVVMNPPYREKMAKAFIERARHHARKSVSALVRLDFLGSQERSRLINQSQIVHVLGKRPCMPPGILLRLGIVQARGGQHDYCWVTWLSGETGISGPKLRSLVPGAAPSRVSRVMGPPAEAAE